MSTDTDNTIFTREEDSEIEYKESISGLKSEDLVAFANSKSGGFIFIGVKDDISNAGRQIGSIVGCKINDSSKLSILDRAQSCRPAVNVEITNLKYSGKDIYRIYIPSGDHKPYCTEGGTYKIRDDGRNRALYPNELLSLFMETERDKFLLSFKEATTSMEDEMIKTREVILNETNEMITKLKNFEESVYSTLNNIESSAENAETSSDNIESTIDNIEENVKDIWSILSYSLYLLPQISSQYQTTRDVPSLTEIQMKEKIIKQVSERFLKRYCYR